MAAKPRANSQVGARHYRWKAGRANAVELHIGASKYTKRQGAKHKARQMGKLGAAGECRSLSPEEIAALGYGPAD